MENKYKLYLWVTGVFVQFPIDWLQTIVLINNVGIQGEINPFMRILIKQLNIAELATICAIASLTQILIMYILLGLDNSYGSERSEKVIIGFICAYLLFGVIIATNNLYYILYLL